jgi:orotidine-5'-phosphate decarboxylase
MSEVIVALDYPDAESAWRMVEQLPDGQWFKVGLELFTAAGPDFVRRLEDADHPVFLDLKVHDIPHTAARAAAAAAGLGARLMTVHAAGGAAMIRAATDAAGSASGGRLKIVAVTVLTSLSDESLGAVMGEGARVAEAVGRLAGLAYDAGADGVVASVHECAGIKATCGESFLVVTPGIRLPGDAAHDQRRVATPAVAEAAGADYLVVGRSITTAPVPATALGRVRAELASS